MFGIVIIETFQQYQECPPETPYYQVDQCVEMCSGQYAIPETYPTDNVCTDNCIYYIQDDGVRHCINDCEGQYQYFVYLQNPINDVVYYCTDNCSKTEYPYLYIEGGSTCVSSCSVHDNRIPQDGICVLQCKIETHPYIQNGECVQECTEGYVRPLEGNQCNNECNYYQPQGQTYYQCIESTCPDQYNFIQYITETRYECLQSCDLYYQNENSEQICVTSCEDITVNEQLLQYIENGVCVDSCKEEQNIYIQQNTCTDQCSGNYAVPISPSNECSEECLYYMNEQTRTCTESCSEQNQYQVPDEIRPYCITDCTQIEYQVVLDGICANQCNEQKQLIEDGICVAECTTYTLIQGDQCVESCDPEYNYVENNVCSQSCSDQNPFVEDIEQTQYQCVSNCGELEPQKYSDAYSDPKKCVDSCTDATYQIQQGFECVEQCTGYYAKPSDNNVCSQECNYYFNTEIQGNECVENCLQDYKFIQYITKTRYQCLQACDVYYYENENQQQICVETCEGVSVNGNPLQYIENKQCVQQCNTETYPVKQGYICLEQCGTPYYEYQQDNECVEQCTDEYYWPEEGSIVCSSTCDYYIDSINSRNQCVTECPEEYDYYVYHEQQRYECVQNCQDSQYTYLNGTRNICTDTCQNINIGDITYNYVQQNQCIEKCTEQYAIPTDGIVCDDQCNYYYPDNSQIKQCITGDCSTVPGQGHNYIIQDGDRLQCVQQCGSEYPIPMEGVYVCNMDCAFIIEENEEKQCVSEGTTCPFDQGMYLVENTQDGYQCTTEVPEYYRELDDGSRQAMSSCSGSYPYLVDETQTPKQCIEGCQYLEPPQFGYQGDEQFICVENCEEVNEQYVNGNICVQSCPPPGMAGAGNLVQNGYCTHNCENEYARPEQGNICDNQCKYCTSQCPPGDQMFSSYIYEVQASRKYCVAACSTTEDYLYSQNNQCVSQCSQEYPVIQDYQCLSTCEGGEGFVENGQCTEECSQENPLSYNITQALSICVNSCSEDYYIQENVCVTECSSEYPLIQGNTCQQQCQDPYKWQEENKCLQNCSGEYAYPESGNICDNTCMYQTINDVKYCTQECTEQDQEYILNDPVRQYCVGNCSQQQEYNLSYTDEQNTRYCVSSCPDGYENQDGQCVVVGIPVAVVVVIVVVIIVCVCCCCKKKQPVEGVTMR